MATPTKVKKGLNITVLGKEFFLPEMMIPFTKTHVDIENPRYAYMTGADAKAMEDRLREEADTKSLSRSIEKNQGLLEPIIVQARTDKSLGEVYKVLEGNRRKVAWGLLYQEDKVKWVDIRAFVRPIEMDDLHWDAYLGGLHGDSGKQGWNPFSKAKHILKLDGKMDREDIAQLFCTSKQDIDRMHKAITVTIEYGKFNPDDKEADKKYSHLLELTKVKDYTPEVKKVAFACFKAKKKIDAKEIRTLPQIIQNPDAKSALLADGENSYDDAMEIVNKADPTATKGGPFAVMARATKILKSNLTEVLEQLDVPGSKGEKLFLALAQCVVTAAKRGGKKSTAYEKVKEMFEEEDDTGVKTTVS